MEKQLTKKQKAKLNSFRANKQSVDGNIAFIDKIPAFLSNYNKIKIRIATILSGAQLENASLIKKTAGKSNSRQIVSNKTVAIVNQTLLEEMNINALRLKLTRVVEFAPSCQFVRHRTNKQRAALADYNINTNRLTTLQTAIDTYKADTPKPRTAVSNRKTSNANIAAIIKDLDELFARFDRQIESLTDEHSDFVRTYFSTREIVNPSTIAKKTEENNGGISS